MHTLYHPTLASDKETISIDGDEARHAIRVKRLHEGEHEIVLDGKGLVGRCKVIAAKKTLELEIIDKRTVEKTRPQVYVYSATPKGPRVDWLVDGLVQVGAACWVPLRTKLGIVDPRENKLERLRRISTESLKQSRRPWKMEIGDQINLEAALEPAKGVQILLADPDGEPYEPTGAAQVRLLVGPEGGWRPEEIEQAQAAGARLTSFGAHVMRIEMACPAATSIILDLERRNRKVMPIEKVA